MLKTYLTTTPLQGGNGLKSWKYEGASEEPMETPFPVLQVMKDTLNPTDTARVVMVHLKTADADRNLERFYEEAAKLNITKEMVTVVTMPEEQNSRTLVQICRDVVNALPEKTGLYVDITYGTKTIPVLLLSAINCAEKVRNALEVYGVYYGDLRRENGVPKSGVLLEVSVLYQLAGAMSACETGESAANAFRLLTDLAEQGEK